MYRYAYLHGFASSRLSRKGQDLRGRLEPYGIELELLELNVPRFETQTYSDILRALDHFDSHGAEGVRHRLIGSSMGGYLAARWAELRPDRVDRLFLLCPGFDQPSRWPRLLGEEALQRWERDGFLEVEDGAGTKRPLHWRFAEDVRRHPAFPEVRCPTTILHGTRDDVVPVSQSRSYAATRPHVELIEVEDDHRLLASVERIATEVRRFLGPDTLMSSE
jgi:pimeloyl-ACP methyl ester carboxylesterase